MQREASPAASVEEGEKGSKSPKAQLKKINKHTAKRFEKTHLVLSHDIKKAHVT